MDRNKSKGRNIELLQDLNGVGVQVFVLGGETKSIPVDTSIIIPCREIRVYNPSIDTDGSIVCEGTPEGDVGYLIPPKGSEILALPYTRMQITVKGTTLNITYVKDKSE